MDLNTPLAEFGPVFRMKGKVLKKAGFETAEDLLMHIPFRYEQTIVSKIGIAQTGEIITIQGEVTTTSNVFTKRGTTIQRITVADETGKIDCIFFNQRFILSNIHNGDFLSASGRVENFGSRKTLAVRGYEVLPTPDSVAIHTTGLVPVYSEIAGLSSKWIRGRIKTIFDKNPAIEDFMPTQILKQNKLLRFSEALHKIHFPKNLTEAESARERLSFDELFLKHAASISRKEEWESLKNGLPFEVEKYMRKINQLIKSLPFELTSAQNRAINEVFSDMKRDVPMNRLLEGDVGSGKTIVATIAAYLAYLNGYQTAIMAPTEILANQHFMTVSSLLEPFGIKVRLFTGPGNKRLGKDNDGLFNVAVGTHALLNGKLEFYKLGFVVIDEQQRFGVEQRATIKEKGENPHLLTMTATPIPRTIFLTIYADLALSLLDELPKGRKKIKTWLVPEEKRENGYKWIADKVRSEKSSVFIVCPFIEPSETLTTVKAVKEEFERLKNNIFPKFKLGLLHGKMKSKDKDEVVSEFKNGDIDILVATPVIEVGIDIPSADIIVIEAAERFGLAQLHQLRGRVGRGEKESYCLLYSGSESEKTRERLAYLQSVNNGAELAELDLRLRGPGEMYGTMQHGIPDLKIASLSDAPLIKSSRSAAEQIFETLNKYPSLKEKIERIEIPRISKD